jgi:two-component system, NtrC family, response regulator AtoC
MHILVADDERSILNTVVLYLREQGHQVDYAADGEQALKAVEESSPDVVLSDLRMPGIDGMTLLKRIKALDEKTEVIIISGFGDMDLVIQSQRNGAFDFIRKPIDFRELDLALQRTARFRQARWEKSQADKQLDLMEKSSPVGGEIEHIIGESQPIHHIKDLIRKVAATERTTVLITGETGTGKELVARAIHHLSSRESHPFIPVNCTSLTQGLAESELFGHEPGAFTGARGRKAGFFELADKGTLFLDEIGDMEPGLQSRLLRVLEAYSFFRVGGKKEITVDIRVIAATNKNLHEMARAGAFRLDLLHRLEVFTICTPPLRSIASDIESLCSTMVAIYNRELKRNIQGINPKVLEALKTYSFPGNIRELRNMIERAMILSGGQILELDDFPNLQTGQAWENHSGIETAEECLQLEEVERRLLRRALEKAGGVKLRAADILGISRESLRRRMEKFGIGS